MFTKPGYAPVLPGLVVLDLQGCHGGPNGEREEGFIPQINPSSMSVT